MGAVLSCCVCLPYFLVYPAIGVLAVIWTTPPRSAGRGAKQGALTGLVAGVVDSVFTLIWMLVLVLVGVSQQYLERLPVETFDALQEGGMLFLFTPSGLMVSALCSSVVLLVWAVASGALGGAIYAAAKPD